MSSDAKKAGTKMKIANPPNKNGSTAWENFGNLFLDASGRRGTFYLDVTVGQLEDLLKIATDGRIKRKISVFAARPKDGGKSA